MDADGKDIKRTDPASGFAALSQMLAEPGGELFFGQITGGEGNKRNDQLCITGEQSRAV